MAFFARSTLSKRLPGVLLQRAKDLKAGARIHDWVMYCIVSCRFRSVGRTSVRIAYGFVMLWGTLPWGASMRGSEVIGSSE